MLETLMVIFGAS